MSILAGLLKDKNGNILHPESDFTQIIDTTDNNKTLAAWRAEVDASIPTAAQKALLANAGAADGVAVLGTDGKLALSVIPSVLTNNKGVFVTASALPESGDAGDYAICTDTDTVWVWDAEKDGGAGWIDSGTKGAVTTVNGQTGDVEITLDSLGLTVSADDINGFATDITTLTTSVEAAQTAANDAKTAAEAAQAEAEKVDFAVVANGSAVPTGLRDSGLYFELAETE